MIPGDEARQLGAEIVTWLRDGCAAIYLAGSARRGAAECHDLELVMVPRIATLPRILQEPERVSLLDPLIDRYIRARRWEPDRRVRRWGTRLKRLWLPSAAIPVELYICQPGNLGNILAIRTGDSAFSKALVTPRRKGGLLPDGLHQAHGFLWDYTPSTDERLMLTSPPRPPLRCPTEAKFFERLGFPEVPDPATRTASGAREWRAHLIRRSREALPEGARP